MAAALAHPVVRTSSEPVRFRHALRALTRPSHDVTEQIFDRFTTDPAQHMGWFLAAQHAGLTALVASTRQVGRPIQPVTDDLLSRLDTDLAHLGLSATPVAPTSHPLDPLAVDYLILGSRHGTEVLRRQLLTQPDITHIPSYFLAPARPDLWHAHCAALDAVDRRSEHAKRIILDTRTAFELFSRAANAQDIFGKT